MNPCIWQRSSSLSYCRVPTVVDLCFVLVFRCASRYLGGLSPSNGKLLILANLWVLLAFLAMCRDAGVTFVFSWAELRSVHSNGPSPFVLICVCMGDFLLCVGLWGVALEFSCAQLRSVHRTSLPHIIFYDA